MASSSSLWISPKAVELRAERTDKHVGPLLHSARQPVFREDHPSHQPRDHKAMAGCSAGVRRVLAITRLYLQTPHTIVSADAYARSASHPRF